MSSISKSIDRFAREFDHARGNIAAFLLENKRINLHESRINSSLTTFIVNILPLGRS